MKVDKSSFCKFYGEIKKNRSPREVLGQEGDQRRNERRMCKITLWYDVVGYVERKMKV